MKKLLFLWAICFPSMAQTLDQYQTFVNGGGTFDSESTESLGQIFTAGLSGPLTQITLKLASGTGATYTATMKLYATDAGGIPIFNNVLATATTTVSGPIPNFLQFNEFTFVFSSPYSIAKNTKYAFAISAPASGSPQVISYGRDNYDRGNEFIKFPGSPLIVISIADLYFKTYVTGPLPVQLISFTAREDNAQSVLEWQTSMESNTSHFEVQRSLNAKGFETIGRVRAAGNSTTEQRYAFRYAELHLLPSVVYYRLRSVDFDGSYSDSKIIALTRTSTDSNLRVYPNPVVSGGAVHIDRPLNNVAVYDPLGRWMPVQVSSLVFGKTDINLGRLPAGTYMLKLMLDEGSQTQKLVVE